MYATYEEANELMAVCLFSALGLVLLAAGISMMPADALARSPAAAGAVKWRLSTAPGPSAAGYGTMFILAQTRRNWRSD
jgi:Mn2+/Fe2+ NRAMP family transporter